MALLKVSNMRKILFLFLLFSFSFASTSVDSLFKSIEGCPFIEASFIQKVYVQGEKDPQTFKGKLFISKRGKIKILYTEPLKQIIFIEKDKSTIYTPEENQVIVSKLPEDFIVGKIFRAFSDNKSLERFFSVTGKKKEEENITVYLKTEDKNIEGISIKTDRENKIKQIQITDKEKNRVILIFNNFLCKKNGNIELKLPEGVDIIHY